MSSQGSHTSDSPVQDADTLEAIYELFDAQHIKVIKAVDYDKGSASKNGSTRPPGDFDIHLAPEQRLKHIICVPGLADDLRQLAEAFLSGSDLPAIPEAVEFPVPEVREEMIEETPAHKIGREADLQLVYIGSTARICSLVASQLLPVREAFRGADVCDWDPTLLSWTIKSGAPPHAKLRAPTPAPKRQKRVPKPEPPYTQSSESEADSDYLDASSETSDSESHASDRTINLNTSVEFRGDEELSQDDLTSLGYYEDDSLRGPNLATNDEEKKPQRESKPLADGYLWLNTKSVFGQHFNCLAIWEFKSMTVAGLKKMSQIAYGHQDGKLFEGTYCGKNDYCLLHHNDRSTRRCKMGPDAEECLLPSVEKAINGDKPQLVSKNAKEFFETNPEGNIYEAVKHIIQQIWGEATFNDVTFLVFNAGNSEIIAIRHRSSGTLYISEIIEVPTSNYYKLHIGLYLATVVDLSRRWNSLAKTSCPTWKDADIQLDWRSEAVDAIQNLVRLQIASRPWLSMKMKTMSSSVVPFRENAYYYACKLPGFDFDWTQKRPRINEDTHFWIEFLSSWAGKHVNKGNLRLPKLLLPEGASLPTLTVRVADNNDEVLALRMEWQLVLSSDLRARAYGLYMYEHPSDQPGSQDDGSETPGAVFVMDDPRKSVEEWSKVLVQRPADFISLEQQSKFRDALIALLASGWVIPTLKDFNLAIHGDDHTSLEVSIFNFARQAFETDHHKSDDDHLRDIDVNLKRIFATLPPSVPDLKRSREDDIFSPCRSGSSTEGARRVRIRADYLRGRGFDVSGRE